MENLQVRGISILAADPIRKICGWPLMETDRVPSVHRPRTRLDLQTDDAHVFVSRTEHASRLAENGLRRLDFPLRAPDETAALGFSHFEQIAALIIEGRVVFRHDWNSNFVSEFRIVIDGGHWDTACAREAN